MLKSRQFAKDKICQLGMEKRMFVYTYGQRTPSEALKSKTFGSYLGYFRLNYQHQFWYSESHVFHYPAIISTKNQALISTSQISIGYQDFNLGPKELGIQPFTLLFCTQSYIYQVLQTIPLKLILLCAWAEPAVLGSAKTALTFKYKI